MTENEHIVSSFTEDLTAISQKIAQMGGLAEEQLASSLEALAGRDQKLANKIISSDEVIDSLERDIEEQAVLLIAKRQPMAVDLRQVMVAIKISTDLERIGDLAKNIAKRTLAVQGEGPLPKRIVSGLKRIGALSQKQLQAVLNAYASMDADLAVQIWKNDEEVDSMYNSLFRELLTYMMEDPRNIGVCTHLLFGAKNIERIGDHATNIAENVYYLVHGKTMDEERPKSDVTSETPVEIGT